MHNTALMVHRERAVMRRAMMRLGQQFNGGRHKLLEMMRRPDGSLERERRLQTPMELKFVMTSNPNGVVAYFWVWKAGSAWKEEWTRSSLSAIS